MVLHFGRLFGLLEIIGVEELLAMHVGVLDLVLCHILIFGDVRAELEGDDALHSQLGACFHPGP